MKKIAFLSFGHWTALPQSQTQSAGDTLLQSIDLAEEAERLWISLPAMKYRIFVHPRLLMRGLSSVKVEFGLATVA
jgi:hypothetical protein